jgi:hypothetical protein
VALGVPTSCAGAEATDAVKVRVCDPPVVIILKLSNVATPAVVERTSVPETVPSPVARVTVIEYLEALLLAARRAFENSSLRVATGEGLKS